MSKLEKNVIGISALLVHAANIDETYSNNEKVSKGFHEILLKR